MFQSAPSATAGRIRPIQYQRTNGRAPPARQRTLIGLPSPGHPERHAIVDIRAAKVYRRPTKTL